MTTDDRDVRVHCAMARVSGYEVEGDDPHPIRKIAQVLDDRDVLAGAYQEEKARADKLAAEVERLRQWKVEAMTVMDGLQELGKALALPLGERVTGPAAVAEVKRLRAKVRRVKGERAFVDGEQEADS